MSDNIIFTLADYSDNILDDKINIIILSWIEKSGTITDKEIISELGIKKDKLTNTLLKLYHNNLLSVNDDFYKMTLKGKSVLDRLNISDNIINYTCGHVKEIDHNVNYLRDTFFSYRENYYDDYLHTLNHIKIWDRILDSKSFKDADLSFKVATKFIIFIIDLCQIISTNINKDDFKDRVFLLIDHLAPKDKISKRSNTKKSSNSTHYEYSEFGIIKYLTLEFDTIKTIDELNKYDNKTKEFYQFLHYRFFLKNINLETKFQRFIDKGKYSDLSENTHYAFTKFNDYCDKSLNFNENYLSYFHDYGIKNVNNIDLDNINSVTFLLKNTKNIQELAIRYHTTEDNVLLIINELRKNINRLKSTSYNLKKSKGLPNIN